jgi:hypothetical protein
MAKKYGQKRGDCSDDIAIDFYWGRGIRCYLRTSLTEIGRQPDLLSPELNSLLLLPPHGPK